MLNFSLKFQRLFLRCSALGIFLSSFFGGLPGFRSELAAAEVGAEQIGQPLTLRVDELKQHVTFFPPVARPGMAAVRRFPAVVVLHPGFLGDDHGSGELARALARRGVFTVMPTYRGQRRALDKRRSEGSIEFCSGEVDDAQEVIAWLRTREDVDPYRIGLVGMSHGGCIALRTAIREPRIRAVAVISAPVAAQKVVEHLLAHPYQFFLYDGILASQLMAYIGGSPELVPESYAVRSPLFLAGKLTMPLFILHGRADHLVPAEQACWLAQVLQRNGRQIRERWLGSDGKELLHPPLFCELTPSTPATPGELQAPHTELWLAKGQDHIFFSPKAQRAAQAAAVEFLLSELTP
jgi:dienelactone hydrolase